MGKSTQVLVVGGSGVVGREALRWSRRLYPEVDLLVGGRRIEVAADAAATVSGARAVLADTGRPDLGVDESVDLGGVLLLAPDDGLHGLRLAQDRGVPYVSVSIGLPEVGPELAHAVHRPAASPVVLASHWWGSAAVFLALDTVRLLDSVSSIRISSVLDEQDAAGPTALEDMERLQSAVPATLAFEAGRRTWLDAEAARASVPAIDGRVLEGRAYSPFDVVGLHAATMASDVRFDLAVGESSSRRRGDGVAAELVVDVEGTRDGTAGHARSTLEFPLGQASLTALGAVLTLATAMGADDTSTPVAPGLYLPEGLHDSGWFLDQLRQSGATVELGSFTARD